MSGDRMEPRAPCSRGLQRAADEHQHLMKPYASVPALEASERKVVEYQTALRISVCC